MLASSWTDARACGRLRSGTRSRARCPPDPGSWASSVAISVITTSRLLLVNTRMVPASRPRRAVGGPRLPCGLCLFQPRGSRAPITIVSLAPTRSGHVAQPEDAGHGTDRGGTDDDAKALAVRGDSHPMVW